jgi:Reverse transcriptase (RNA-dependent DNA polymerase)
MEKNKLGPQFKLKRGNAQGDTISPYLFNICYQILLMKFEFDLQIQEPIPFQPPVPASTLLCAPLVEPVSFISKRVFAFADDCNLICNATSENLSRIKTILDEFKLISGLECNVEKSNFLKFGTGTADPEHEIINTYGFVKKPKLTILGMDIYDNLDQILEGNSSVLTKKLNDQVTRWSRFGLSLPGRINICKTMLYSQLCYLGSFLPFKSDTLKQWEQIISSYAKGNLNISRERVFKKIELSGLGLFELQFFLGAQQISWIIRATREVDSDWKQKLWLSSVGDFYRYDMNRISYLCPCIQGLVENLNLFKQKYAGIRNNYMQLGIVNEPALTTGLRKKEYLTEPLLTGIIGQDTGILLSTLTLTDIQTRSQEELGRYINANVDGNLHRLLHKVLAVAGTRFRVDDPLVPGTSLPRYFASWKKGSKRIRNILSLGDGEYIPHNIVKFAYNTETVIGLEHSKTLNKCWNVFFISNSFRTFLFKLHNNTLSTIQY